MAYGLYDGSLKSIPGLGGYLQQTELNQQGDARNLQNGVALMSLIKEQKAQQDDAAVRQVLSQGGEPGQVIQSLLKVGSPQAVQMAQHVMTINQAQQSLDALKGLNYTGPNADPAKLEQVGTMLSATGHPGGAAILNLAKTMRQEQADIGEHKAQMGTETPITNAPTMGFQPGRGFAERSQIDAGGATVPAGVTPNDASLTSPNGWLVGTGSKAVPGQQNFEEIPAEVQAAIDSGKPFSMGVGSSSNPAENTQRTGALFEPFAQNDQTRSMANSNQTALNASNPLTTKPSVWDKNVSQLNTTLLTQGFANSRSDQRNATTLRGQQMRQDNILLSNGINPDGTLNESGKQMAQAIANGQLPPLTGAALIRPGGRAIMSEVMGINPKYEAQQYGLGFATEKAFTSGKNGNTIRSFNTAIDHLGTLGELADALNNGDVQLVNRIGNYIATQTGNPAPNNFEAAKQIVGDEIVKAIVGAGGGVGDREKAQAAISGASSPEQLKGVIDTYKKLMGGQLHGLYQQYTSGGGKKDFRSFLTEESKAMANLPGEGAPLGPNQVKLPDGRVKTFPSPAAAQGFKAAAGL